jgi:hypothetical protein
MPKQIAEVVIRSLYELRALGVGQSPSLEDTAAIDVAACVALLHGKRAVDLRNAVLSDAIPDEFFYPLALYCAGRNGPGFGLPAADAMVMEARGEQEIRQIAAPFYYDDVQPDYF